MKRRSVSLKSAGNAHGSRCRLSQLLITSLMRSKNSTDNLTTRHFSICISSMWWHSALYTPELSFYLWLAVRNQRVYSSFMVVKWQQIEMRTMHRSMIPISCSAEARNMNTRRMHVWTVIYLCQCVDGNKLSFQWPSYNAYSLALLLVMLKHSKANLLGQHLH